MSMIKLIQQIREASKALQNARDVEDWELVESLEDELYELELNLENEEYNTQKYEWL